MWRYYEFLMSFWCRIFIEWGEGQKQGNANNRGYFTNCIKNIEILLGNKKVPVSGGVARQEAALLSLFFPSIGVCSVIQRA